MTQKKRKKSVSFKRQVLKVYPHAVCLEQPGRPGVYRVQIEMGGPIIAGGPTAALAWKLSLRKMKGHELK